MYCKCIVFNKIVKSKHRTVVKLSQKKLSIKYEEKNKSSQTKKLLSIVSILVKDQFVILNIFKKMQKEKT